MERSELEFELSEEIWKLYPGLKMSDYDKIAKLSVQKVLDNIDKEDSNCYHNPNKTV